MEKDDHLLSSSETSTPEARCPHSCLQGIHALIDSGVSNEVIELAIEGYQRNEDAASEQKTYNVHKQGQIPFQRVQWLLLQHEPHTQTPYYRSPIRLTQNNKLTMEYSKYISLHPMQ